MRRARATFTWFGVAAASLGFFPTRCPTLSFTRREPRVSVEELVLARQKAGLLSLLASVHEGHLVSLGPDTVIVAIDQSLIQMLLRTLAPAEYVIAEKYRVTVTSATVDFEDGFPLVRLDGRATFLNQLESAVFAEMSVYGSLDVMGRRPDSGHLVARVQPIAAVAHHVEVFRQSDAAERLVEDLAREKIESFAALAMSFEVPVHVMSEVTVPAVHGVLHIPATPIPLELTLLDVKAFHGKLWVSLRGGAPAR